MNRRVSSGYQPIGAHGVIGNCRTAALVTRDGSIDWLCLPRFDSPSVFGRILDQHRGGHFSVRPVASFQTKRRYLPHTNVLETQFHTAEGFLRVLDVMPLAHAAESTRSRWPRFQVLRIAECMRGQVELEVSYEPRPEYGAREAKLEDRGAEGVVLVDGPKALALRADIPLDVRESGSAASGRATLATGERAHLALLYADVGDMPPVPDSMTRQSEEMLRETVRWWEDWISSLEYDGPFRDAVERSALVLKLLTYAPSGALLAAPTTSLPEQIGGERNWDYRFCWLRDASLTLRALFDLGFTEEGDAFFTWLLDATARTRPNLQAVYDVQGGTDIVEEELGHLEGYMESRPVRIGNAARNQLQLDVYGDVMDGVYEYVRRGGTLDDDTIELVRELCDTVCERWTEPDEGIWEIRSERQHHTYSKVMCWVALDRMIRLHREGHLQGTRDGSRQTSGNRPRGRVGKGAAGASVNGSREMSGDGRRDGGLRLDASIARYEEVRRKIRLAVEERGYDPELRSYVGVFEQKHVDASLFLLGRYGYTEPGSRRMRNTCARLHQELGRDSLIYRYVGKEDGLPFGEGAFGICSFWAVECLCRQGRMRQARQSFQDLLARANDLGLYGEQIDPETGAPLGNFPQAFTHVGLIDAALTMAECMGRPQEEGEVGERDRPAEVP